MFLIWDLFAISWWFDQIVPPQLEYYISVLCPRGFTSRGIYDVDFDKTVKVYTNSLFSPLYLIGILSEILLDPEAILSFYLPVIYLLSMWTSGLLFYTMNYNLLSIFILIFTLSQIWPAGTSAHWLLCPFDEPPWVFWFFKKFFYILVPHCILGSSIFPAPALESATSLIGHWCYIQEKTESSEPLKISKATIVLRKNLLLIKSLETRN